MIKFKEIVNIIIIPIIISIGVSLYMQDVFTEQQIKKELSLDINLLQDDIVKYNETYSLNSPFYFLLLLDLDKSFVLNDSNFKFYSEMLQKSIHNAQGTSIDIELAKYLLNYMQKNTISENVAYFKLIRVLENYKYKYQIIKTELELIHSKINLLNDKLKCSKPNLLNNIYDELKERESLNDTFFSNMQKQLDIEEQEGADKFEAYKNLKEKISPLYIIDILSNKTIEENAKAKEDKINNLIKELIQLNGNYLLNYNYEKIAPNEYCEKIYKTTR